MKLSVFADAGLPDNTSLAAAGSEPVLLARLGRSQERPNDSRSTR